MNVLFAGKNEFNPQIGGTERVSVTLAGQLQQVGYGVFFIALAKHPWSKPYSPVAEQIILPNEHDVCCEENIRCFSNFVLEKKIDVILNQFGNLRDFSNLCMMVKQRTGIKLFSVLHIDPSYELKLYQADLSLLDCPSLLTRQVKFYLKKMFPFKLKRLMKDFSFLYHQLYMESDAVVLLSDRFKPVFQKMAGLTDISKLEAIGNPLSFRTTEETYQKEKQILWIGRFDLWHKRPERLVQIWSYLENRHPDWNVLFLGDGRCKPKVEHFVQRLGLKNVHFGGFDDPMDAYRKSSILCMTSTFEGLPMVLLEAMQFGAVPMAFSSFESVFDIINDGVTGYLVEPFDLKQYASRLESIIMDENRRETMAQNAKTYVTDKFDVHHITQKWISLFKKY